MSLSKRKLSHEKLVYLSTISEKKWMKFEYQKYVCTDANFDLHERTKNIKDVKKILESINLKFWITNGTALAAVRDKNWIPWDDDVDLDVLMEDYLKIDDQLYDLFIENNFIVRKKFVKDNKRSKLSIYRGGEKTSIRPLYLSPKFENNKYRLRNYYKYPRQFYENEEKILFLGDEYNIPSPSEEFLEWCYGKNWRTPLNSDNESEYSTTQIRRKVSLLDRIFNYLLKIFYFITEKNI